MRMMTASITALSHRAGNDHHFRSHRRDFLHANRHQRCGMIAGYYVDGSQVEHGLPVRLTERSRRSIPKARSAPLLRASTMPARSPAIGWTPTTSITASSANSRLRLSIGWGRFGDGAARRPPLQDARRSRLILPRLLPQSKIQGRKFMRICQTLFHAALLGSRSLLRLCRRPRPRACRITRRERRGERNPAPGFRCCNPFRPGGYALGLHGDAHFCWPAE